MNASELIASGLLEAYVLGEGSAEERALVERMARTEPGVRAELDAIERSLEAHAFANAVAPPPQVRERVLDAIGGGSKVVPLNAQSPPRHSFNWLAAASVAALAASAVGNFFLYDELRDVRTRLAELGSEREILAQQLQVQRTTLERSENELAVLVDPSMRTVELKGMGNAPDARARIYWDPAKRAVHMGPASLPAPPQGMQYQLWAMVDGKPVDAGLMPLVSDSALIHRMKDIGPAEAFAVTLEKAGGVPSPTLEALVLMGRTAVEG